MVTNMLSAQPVDEATIFNVLADRARSHSTRFLGTQAGVAIALAATLAGVAPSWWPVAALLLAVSAYSRWSILEARERDTTTHSFAFAKRALVVIATVACVAAVAGTAIAAFVGDAPSPYGTCYGSDGRGFSCDARGHAR